MKNHLIQDQDGNQTAENTEYAELTSATLAFSAVEIFGKKLGVYQHQGGVIMKKINDFLYEELSGKAIGAAIEVHKILGSGFLEAVYQEALEVEFGLQKIPFESQLELEITYKDITLKQRYKPDFVLHNYLKATGLKLGLLLNFGGPTLEIKRIIRSI